MKDLILHRMAWCGRLTSFGHGRGQKMSSTEALAIAAAAGWHAPCRLEAGMGFESGQAVTVSATDYGADPVAGALVGLTNRSVTVSRHDERAGHVHAHFPRLGFQIKPATEAGAGA